MRRDILTSSRRRTVHDVQQLERNCTDDYAAMSTNKPKETKTTETKPTAPATAETTTGTTSQWGSHKVEKPSPQLRGPMGKDEQCPVMHDASVRVPASTPQTKPSLIQSPNDKSRQSNTAADTCTAKEAPGKDPALTSIIHAPEPGNPYHDRPKAPISQTKPKFLRQSSSDAAYSGQRKQRKTESAQMLANNQPQRPLAVGPEYQRQIRQGSAVSEVGLKGVDGLRRSKSEKASKTTQVLRRRARGEKAVDFSTAQDRVPAKAKSRKTTVKPQKEARQGPSKESAMHAFHSTDSHFFTIGAFSALAPRPNFRYTDPPPVARSSTSRLPLRPSSINVNGRTQEAPDNLALGFRKRITEGSADDLSSASIRYLMEKKSKRSHVSNPTAATSKVGSRTDGLTEPRELAREQQENKENATDGAASSYQGRSHTQAPGRFEKQLQERKPSIIEDVNSGNVDKSTLPARTSSNKYRASFRPSVTLEMPKQRQEQSAKHPSSMSSAPVPSLSSYPSYPTHQQGFFSPVPRSLTHDPNLKSNTPIVSMFSTGWTLVRRNSRRTKGLQQRQQVKSSSETGFYPPKKKLTDSSPPVLDFPVKGGGGESDADRGKKGGVFRSKSARISGRMKEAISPTISPNASSKLDQGPSAIYGKKPRTNTTTGFSGTVSGSIDDTSTATVSSPVTQNQSFTGRSATYGTSTTTATTMSDSEAPLQKPQHSRDLHAVTPGHKSDTEGSTLMGNITRRFSRRRRAMAPLYPRKAVHTAQQASPTPPSDNVHNMREPSSIQNSAVDISRSNDPGVPAHHAKRDDVLATMPTQFSDLMPAIFLEEEGDQEMENLALADVDVYRGQDDSGVLLKRLRTTPARKSIVVHIAKDFSMNAVEPEIVNNAENA